MRASNEERRSMLALIEKWQKSGMRQIDFCRQHNLPSHVFYYWYKCYRNGPPSKAPKTLLPADGFIPLQPSPLPSVARIEIRLPNGTQLFFSEGVSADYLKALIC